MAQVNIAISGKTYRMACDDGQEEHLIALGERLNRIIDELRGQFGEIGDQRLTVMAAITMADRFSEAEQRLQRAESEVAGLRQDRSAVAEHQDAIEAGLARSMEAVAARLEALAARLNAPEPGA